jgi:hypothetical protein
MSALEAIENNLRQLGYSAIRRDYRFDDVLAKDLGSRVVDLAAFTQFPESFRSAAFGVIEDRGENLLEAIKARRALGAPLFLSISGQRISVWRVDAIGVPRCLDTVGFDALDELFARNAGRWSPQALHRAKSLPPASPQQLDFVDLGLLPAIEREIQTKLHQVLGDVLRGLLGHSPDEERERAAFRATFRLLAAKILKDREHEAATQWARGDVEQVLGGIAAYYKLPQSQTTRIFLERQRLEAAWERLSNVVSLQNISADTLAFVYENTLVTADTRKRFGTHSTPRQIADYVLGRLDLSRFDLKALRIHEPFAGAGAFLVAAVRHLQDLLPTEWSPEKRHDFLLPRLSGSEIDAFACEVAMLSLILADYPNSNGWEIHPNDLFEKQALAQALAGSTVILCNPPFEDFNDRERQLYPETVRTSVSKARFAFMSALEAKPEALGFVMPHGFLRQKQFGDLRKKLVGQYKSLELVSLPEGIFQQARYESALVIATELRDAQQAEATRIKTIKVLLKDRKAFLETGEPTWCTAATRPAGGSELWVGPLDELWEWLAGAPKLGRFAEVYRGLKWWKQQDGISETPREGFRPGIYRPKESLRPFKLRPVVRYLSFRPEDVMFPGPPNRPWHKAKVFVNTDRISRGAWRMSAAPDVSGLAASQQFFGVWPHGESISVEALAAILNGPVANAFVTERTSDQHLTNEILKALPMPAALDEPELRRAVADYRTALSALDAGQAVNEAELEARLRRIDELVLDGYGLPMHLRRALFDYFSGERRPVPHRFSGWETAAPKDADLVRSARERALARGMRMKRMDLDSAGGGLSLEAVAELLDEPASKVADLAQHESLLAIPTDAGLVFPAIQFSGHSPLPGLPEFLSIFPDRNPWARLNYLVNPEQRLGGRRPIDSLRSGEVDQVIAAARLVGEHAAG